MSAIPEDTEYFTLKNLTEIQVKQIEEAKKTTLENIENILKLYI